MTWFLWQRPLQLHCMGSVLPSCVLAYPLVLRSSFCETACHASTSTPRHAFPGVAPWAQGSPWDACAPFGATQPVAARLSKVCWQRVVDTLLLVCYGVPPYPSMCVFASRSFALVFWVRLVVDCAGRAGCTNGPTTAYSVSPCCLQGFRMLGFSHNPESFKGCWNQDPVTAIARRKAALKELVCKALFVWRCL